ncbi:helix-turn-helix transcriptional regulator [Protaetiibacter intestinalis]|uniref:Helix-turn-helix transcriptional regulator n=1 Tax=Protaetiibacter intestinalis TaxID=2419774 RepID=A0A387B9U5_9MICO|nr:AAA family ATPase [Protaetiibacter intestinalis]AYF99157.1 helix-turn-helix transcriptional regulator [Protaetiibacter intestinalis]
MRGAPSSPLIGREAELGQLRAAFAEAAGGDARIVVVGGEAGIGKSRLLEEFLGSLDAEVVVTRGQCVEFGAVGLPYAPLTGVFRDLVSTFGEDAVFAAAAGGAEVLRSLVEVRIPDERDERLGIARLDEAVTTVFERLSADRAVVVAIEDLHWADAATLDVLRFLARMQRSGRVLLLLSYRSDDVARGHPLRGLLAELERNRRATRILLERLDATEVRAQAAGILGTAPTLEQARALFERSEGVPFFVEELLSCGLDGTTGAVPSTLRELLLARYETLSAGSRRLMRTLAAGGGHVPHEVLAGVAELDTEPLEEALRSAIEAGVAVVSGRGYDFRHALVREAVAAELLPGEAARVHARYATALEAHPVDPARRAARAVLVSAHWLEAHELESAFRTALEGMWLSRAAYAHASAAQLGERALSLWDRVADPEGTAGLGQVALLEIVARAWRSAGEAPRGLATIEQALAQVDPGDAVQRARLLRTRGLMIDAEGRIEALLMFEEALTLLSDDDDPLLRAGILSEAASKYMVSGRSEQAIGASTRALELAPADAGRIRSVAANVRAGTLAHLGRLDEADEDYALALREAGDDRDALLRYHVNYSDTLHLLGRFRESIAVATEGIRIAEDAGVARTSGAILAVNTVDPLFSIGEWDRADVLIADALDLEPPAVFRTYLRRARIRSVLWRGEPDEARALFELWQGSMTQLAEFEDQVSAGLALDIAEVQLALGRLDDAWEWAGRLVERPRLGSPPWELPVAPVVARIIARRRDAAADPTLHGEQVRALEAVLERDDWPTRPLWRAFAAAELGGPSGAGDDVGLWQHALDESRAETTSVLTRLQLAYGLARAQLRTGDREAATATLGALRDDADRLGATLVVRWADELLHDAGLGGHPVGEARDELTARELQVLELIAEGLSNGQIAERLYISRKTVSVHVSAILRKLGASSRTEAARLHLSRS